MNYSDLHRYSINLLFKFQIFWRLLACALRLIGQSFQENFPTHFLYTATFYRFLCYEIFHCLINSPFKQIIMRLNLRLIITQHFQTVSINYYKILLFILIWMTRKRFVLQTSDYLALNLTRRLILQWTMGILNMYCNRFCLKFAGNRWRILFVSSQIEFIQGLEILMRGQLPSS